MKSVFLVLSALGALFTWLVSNAAINYSTGLGGFVLVLFIFCVCVFVLLLKRPEWVLVNRTGDVFGWFYSKSSAEEYLDVNNFKYSCGGIYRHEDGRIFEIRKIYHLQ